jgi:osmotically-inducible protein OsmY
MTENERPKMKSNAEIQQDVQDAIKRRPLLNAAEIGATAKDGVVSLTDVVDRYAMKTEAEDAAKNAAGVTAQEELLCYTQQKHLRVTSWTALMGK